MVAARSKPSNLTATTTGTANKAYLQNIEPRERKKAFLLDLPIRRGRAWPINTKLMTLKMVPSTTPLPTGLRPARKKQSPRIIAVQIARDPYFFCVCLTDSISPVVVSGFNDLHYLAINRYAAADDSQYCEDGYKYSPGSHPFVQIQSNKKAKKYASGHGQTDLHDNRQVFGPSSIFLIIEKHLGVTDFYPEPAFQET